MNVDPFPEGLRQFSAGQDQVRAQLAYETSEQSHREEVANLEKQVARLSADLARANAEILRQRALVKRFDLPVEP